MATQNPIIGEKPELAFLTLEQLTIPVRYQRALEGSSSMRNITRIQQKFNWYEFGTLLVGKTNKKDSLYNVIDGQHRYRAAQLRDDIEEVPCTVLPPMSVEAQAQIFLNINGYRTPLNPFQSHRAALVALDPVAIELERVCKETEVIIPFNSGVSHQTAPDVVQALNRLRSIIQAEGYKADNLIWSFRTLRAAYPKRNGALKFNMIRALLHWIEKKPGYNKNEAVRVLRSLDLDTIDLKARKIRLNTTGALWRSYYTIMEQEEATLGKKSA